MENFSPKGGKLKKRNNFSNMCKKMFMRVFIVLFILISNSGFGSTDPEKEELHKMVQEREKKFGHYTRAAESKSGFFGNQTKRDLREVNNVLIEIIKTDNKIIFLLNNFLDFRNFQKTEMTYSQKEQVEKINELNKITNNLVKKADEVVVQNKNLQKRILEARVLNYSLAFLCMVLGIVLIKKNYRM